MKIYHVSSPDNLKQIKGSGIIKATPQLVHIYDDYGQEDFEWQNRAFFCLGRQEAEVCLSAFENHYPGQRFVVGQFQASDDLAYFPDPNFRGIGHYSKGDIKIL